MKKNMLSVFLLILFSSLAFAQIPNAGFESWTNSEPDGWITNNIPPTLSTVLQSSDGHTGSSAVKLVFGSFLTLPWGANLYTGDAQTDNIGFPVSEQYGSLRGFYKLDSSPNKILTITVTLKKDGNYITAGGADAFGGSVPNYTEFIIPMTYLTGDIPDTAIITISYYDTSETWTAGGGAYVDDLSFGDFVEVREITETQAPSTYRLFQNYPNPFNPETKIEYSIPEESFVNLKVYNVIGQEVATLVNQHQKAGTYRADFNAEEMQSGIYIVKLTANKFTKSIKMTLLK
jgi:hypothetical protein